MTAGRNIVLRRSVLSDLPVFFAFQLDQEANYLAAFTAKDPTDKPAYLKKYAAFLDDPTINMQTIMVDHVIVGSISKFELQGQAEITYWIDRNVWGQGIASAALKIFLAREKARPIFGRTAFDNFGSQRVLEKCGFVKIGQDKGFAHARQMDIEEFIFRLG